MSQWRRLAHGDGGPKVFSEVALDNSSFLYHYLPWKYAVTVFENRRLRLSPVESWQDPYEKWWCHQLFGTSGKLAGVNAYGLCWTGSHFDEPAWRMNGFNRPTLVRIRCRVGALIAAARRENAHASLYLGKVRYRREEKLRDLAKSGHQHTQLSHQATELLLSKRNAFRFEKEIRLLWFDRAASATEQFLGINPGDICQVMVTPHADRAVCDEIASCFDQLGVATKRSLLLAAP